MSDNILESDTAFENYSVVDFSNSPLNALQELNRGDIKQEFDLRRKLYENSDDFYISDAIEETTDEEFLKLKENVDRGKSLLKNEISLYSSLKDKMEEIISLKNIFHEQITNIRKSALILQEMNIQCEGYEDGLNTLTDSCIAFDKHVKTHLDNEKTIISADYNTSFRKLMQLKDVYKVFRHSDISYVCPLCLTKQVDSFLMSCGHTYCSDCVKRIHRICSICRNPISKIQSLYFS